MKAELNNIMLPIPQRKHEASFRCCQFMSRCDFKMGSNVQEALGDTLVNDKQGQQVKLGRASDYDLSLTSMDGQKEERRVV